jgi:hypothetical protein
VVLQEAGGRLTDTDDQELDFHKCGAKLPMCVEDIIGSNGGVFHKEVLRVYHEQRVE